MERGAQEYVYIKWRDLAIEEYKVNFCLFCGKEPEVKEYHDGCRLAVYRVECPTCRIRAGYHRSVECAILDWNRKMVSKKNG